MSLGVPGRGIESSSTSYRLLGVGLRTEEVGGRGVLFESSSMVLFSSSIGITQNCVVVICDLQDKDNRTNSKTHGEIVDTVLLSKNGTLRPNVLASNNMVLCY